MDKYSVKLSPRALRDLDGIYSYIARTLLEPETALKLVDTITEEILSLDSMPRRCPERKTGAYAGKGYRQLLIKTTPPSIALTRNTVPSSLSPCATRPVSSDRGKPHNQIPNAKSSPSGLLLLCKRRKMNMTHHKLVIAEKPSVAQSIAAVLGATKRNDGYLSGNGYLVSWCFGHLAELAGADVYDEKYAKWRYDDLPILPANWRFTLKADKAKQFELLRDLMRREDVSEVINACDAGREGELIFRTVYYMAGCTKTMKRLWISSMEDAAIKKGFAELRPGREYDGLYQSALCRARADWLVGINATRLFSVLYHRTLNVGRVMTPTLALIVQREAEIGAFRPEAFYTVNLRCGDFAAVSEKFKEKAEADALAAACAGQPVTVRTVQRTEKTENAPRLYDLTTLQREANRSLGYTAQQTLDYLQALYEKKLCTYPRTDSRFLTDDMEASVPELVTVAAAICETTAPEGVNAGQVCDSKRSATTMPSSPPQARARRTCRCCRWVSASFCALWRGSFSGRSAMHTAMRKPQLRWSAAALYSPPRAKPSLIPAGSSISRRKSRTPRCRSCRRGRYWIAPKPP